MSNESLSSLEQSRAHTKQYVAGIMAGLLLVGCSTSETSQEVPIPEVNTAIAPEPSIEQTCSDVEADDIRSVSYLVDRPVDDALIEKMRFERGGLAEELGLTVHDYYETFMEALDGRDPYLAVQDSKVPVELFIDATKTVLDRFDVSLDFPQFEGKENRGYDVRSITVDELDSVQAGQMKKALLNFSQNITFMPAELISLSGLESVKVVYIDQPNVGGFVYQDEPSSMYVNATEPLFDTTFAHELYHLIDYRMCDDIFNDSAFISLNPDGMLYGEYIANDPGLPGYKYDSLEYTGEVETRDLTNEIVSLNGSDDIQKINDINQKIDALYANVVTARNYGFTNVAEDKATIGEEILTGRTEGALVLDRTPVLTDKIKFLLARLYTHDPRLAEYFVLTNTVIAK